VKKLEPDHLAWLLTDQITDWDEAVKAIVEYLGNSSDETLNAAMCRIKQLARTPDTVNRDRLEASFRGLRKGAELVFVQIMDVISDGERDDLLDELNKVTPFAGATFGVFEEDEEGVLALASGNYERRAIGAILATPEGHDAKNKRFFVIGSDVPRFRVVALPRKKRIDVRIGAH
jgi:hypothetical protein